MLWLAREIMKQRLSYVLVLALAAGSFAISACDGDDSSDNDNGGSSGASGGHAGSKTGGSSSGGSSNNAGGDSGGQAGNDRGGTANEGGAAGAAQGGAAGAVQGGTGEGGTGEGGAVGNAGAAGEAGAGGSGAPALTYACGSDTLPKKLCSSFVGANCTDPTVCADCVTERTDERDSFMDAFSTTPCATCTDKFDAYFQCVVDAFESGNITFGVDCVEDYGADISFDNCVPLLDEANDCHTYLNEHECPATWPPT
jgi:hypothetical protein